MIDGQILLLLATTTAGTITTVAGFYFAAKRDNDRHKNALELEKERRAWDLADRERARAALALNVEQRAAVLEQKMDSQHEATVHAVQRVTSIDDKIAELSRVIMGEKPLPDKLDAVSETLDRVDANTKTAVELLQNGVDPLDGR